MQRMAASPAPSPGHHRWGRQAEAERNDRALLDAAREVFAAAGVNAPVSAVASRAGVGMGSLYRRYGSKEELLQRLCQLSMEQTIAEAQAALEDDRDPWSAFADFVRRCVLLRVGALTPLAGTIPVTEEMIATASQAQEIVERLVVSTQASGALRADINSTDIHCLTELFSRRPRSFQSEPDHRDPVAERLLDIALDGLTAGSQHPLALPGPSWDSYRARWVDAPRTSASSRRNSSPRKGRPPRGQS